jgi:hypothetical protein
MFFYNYKKIIFIFFCFFSVRFLFIYLSGFDNFKLQIDSYWYNTQSDNVLNGNFNLLRPLFITAPFFTYFQALIKIIFTNHWMIALEFSQIIISSLSGVFLYKLSYELFYDEKKAIVATIIFCFYPITFWWVGTFTQDIWFQSFLIIFFYYFHAAINKSSLKLIIVSAIIFSVTYHTKSHILLFSVFIPIIIYLKKNLNFSTKIKLISIFASISILFSLPYGIYNLMVNKTYVIGSSGLGGTFLTGHNDDAYLNHLKLNELTAEQKKKFSYNLYSIYQELEAKMKNLNPSEKQKIMLDEGMKWVKENKYKTFELTIYHAKRFFTPGISSFWHPFGKWLVVIIISSPIYVLAYMSIVQQLLSNFNENFWILGLILSLFFFSIFFYYSGRFRVITLEPYYIIFAANFIVNFFKKIKIT